MKTLKWICSIVVVLNFVVAIFFCEQRTPDRQLLFMATSGFLLILLLVSFVAGLRLCVKEKFRAFVPALICVIGLPFGLFVGGRLGDAIENWRFQKNLPRYTEVVQLIEKGEFKTDSSLVELPPQYADLALRTARGTNSEGTDIIVFITGLGFPVKHSGFMYVSTGEIENDAETLRRWPYYSRINTNWFRISD